MAVEARDILEALRANGAHVSTRIEKIKVLTGELKKTLDVPGAVFEFGVYKGAASVPLATTLIEAQSPKALFLYDTFTGLPEGDEEKDIKIKANRGPYPVGTLAYSQPEFEEFFTNALLSLCGETGLYKIYAGDIRETVTKDNLYPVSFAVFDVDYYDTTRHLFETVAPQVSLDGVLYIDDYFTWTGAQQATEEFLRKNEGWEPFIVRVSSPYYFLKRVKL